MIHTNELAVLLESNILRCEDNREHVISTNMLVMTQNCCLSLLLHFVVTKRQPASF